MKHATVQRAGSSLVELLIAIVIGASILGVLGTLMSRVMAANSAAADHLRGVVALSTLGRQFRDDVHATSAAAVQQTDGQPTRLRLSLVGGETVEYEIASERLRRTESADSSPERHETFSLPSMRVTGFQADAAGSGEISIVIGRLAGRPGEDVVTGQFEITALAPRGREEKTP